MHVFTASENLMLPQYPLLSYFTFLTFLVYFNFFSPKILHYPQFFLSKNSPLSTICQYLPDQWLVSLDISLIYTTHGVIKLSHFLYSWHWPQGTEKIFSTDLSSCWSAGQCTSFYIIWIFYIQVLWTGKYSRVPKHPLNFKFEEDPPISCWENGIREFIWRAGGWAGWPGGRLRSKLTPLCCPILQDKIC